MFWIKIDFMRLMASVSHASLKYCISLYTMKLNGQRTHHRKLAPLGPRRRELACALSVAAVSLFLQIL